MSLPSVLEILINSYIQYERAPYRTPRTDESWHRAVNKIWDSITSSNPIIVAVQGPPGTGKTSIYIEEFNRVLANPSEFQNNIFVYVAPTNQLVLQTFARFTYVLMSHLKDFRSVFNYITSKVYVYGSKISTYSSSDLEYLKNIDRSLASEIKLKIDKLHRIKGVIQKTPDMESIEGPIFIFTTEWQQINIEIPSVIVKLLVDEASRSPIHRPFISLAKTIMVKTIKKEPFYISMFSVIGDPEQAIALEPEYREESRRFLIINAVKRLLEKYQLKDIAFEFLEVTKRLPEPTEKPISIAFYDGKLRSSKSSRDALKIFEIEAIRKACREIRQTSSSSYVNTLCSLAESIVSSDIPLGIVSTDTFPPGETFDPKRVKISAILATIYGLILAHQSSTFNIAVIGPYIDTIINAEAYYREISRKIPIKMGIKPLFSTVHSMLGDEADVVIASLGKEWVGREDDPYTTVYFDEPELLNVQFSRHRRTMIVVGDVKKLGSSASKLNKSLGFRIKHGGGESRLLSKLERSKKIKVLCEELENLVHSFDVPQVRIQ